MGTILKTITSKRLVKSMMLKRSLWLIATVHVVLISTGNAAPSTSPTNSPSYAHALPRVYPCGSNGYLIETDSVGNYCGESSQQMYVPHTDVLPCTWRPIYTVCLHRRCWVNMQPDWLVK